MKSLQESQLAKMIARRNNPEYKMPSEIIVEQAKLISELVEALYLAHEHAKLNYSGQYHQGQNVYDSCEQTLAKAKG